MSPLSYLKRVPCLISNGLISKRAEIQITGELTNIQLQYLVYLTHTPHPYLPL